LCEFISILAKRKMDDVCQTYIQVGGKQTEIQQNINQEITHKNVDRET
jgi:hypothetical protein